MFTLNSFMVNVPPGSILAFPSNSIPDGWAKCDGSSYSSVTYPKLFQALGTTTLPNLNAAYLRGTGTSGINGTYTGPTLKTFANDKLKGHSHTLTDPGHQHNYSIGTPISSTGNGNDRSGSTNTETNTLGKVSGISISHSGITETRPYTYVVNWIIKLG